jgi:hypothetical protein
VFAIDSQSHGVKRRDDATAEPALVPQPAT